MYLWSVVVIHALQKTLDSHLLRFLFKIDAFSPVSHLVHVSVVDWFSPLYYFPAPRLPWSDWAPHLIRVVFFNSFPGKEKGRGGRHYYAVGAAPSVPKKKGKKVIPHTKRRMRQDRKREEDWVWRNRGACLHFFALIEDEDLALFSLNGRGILCC